MTSDSCVGHETENVASLFVEPSLHYLNLFRDADIV